MVEPEPQDVSWVTQSYRQNIRDKIKQAIWQYRNPTTKSAEEIENHMFQRANSKEEYLSFVVRLIIHVRERMKDSRCLRCRATSRKICCLKRKFNLVAPYAKSVEQTNNLPNANQKQKTQETEIPSCSTESNEALQKKRKIEPSASQVTAENLKDSDPDGILDFVKGLLPHIKTFTEAQKLSLKMRLSQTVDEFNEVNKAK